MPTVKAAMSGVQFNLQLTATTGNGTVLAIPTSFRYHNFITVGVDTISAGAVTLETSYSADDTATWAPLASAITVTTADQLTQYVGLLTFVRARVSTTVTGGGTVAVVYTGAKNY